MDATITILRRFIGIRVGNYICHACQGMASKIEYTPKYTLIFLLKGSFRHNSFKSSSLLNSEQIIFKKPKFDYTVTHEHYVQDDCLFIEFGDDVLEHLAPTFSITIRDFLKNGNASILLIKSNPWKHVVSWYLAKAKNKDINLPFEQLTLWLIESTLSSENGSYVETGNILHDAVDKAKQYIAQNFRNDISLAEIATASHTSPYHFSRVFKQETQFSPHQFLMNVRIDHACMHLSHTNVAVGDVCYDSGFSNPDYFINIFKKKMGITPGQYRLKFGLFLR